MMAGNLSVEAGDWMDMLGIEWQFLVFFSCLLGSPVAYHEHARQEI